MKRPWLTISQTLPNETDKPFRLVLYDALASEAMGTLTTGVFLAGFLVDLGASNVAIGVLAAVPFAVQFLQLPAGGLGGGPPTPRGIFPPAAPVCRAFLVLGPPSPLPPANAGGTPPV